MDTEKKEPVKEGEEEEPKIIAHYPQQHVIVKACKENTRSEQEAEDIKIKIVEAVCEYVKGKPTGASNLAVTKDMLVRGVPKAPPSFNMLGMSQPQEPEKEGKCKHF